MIKKPRIKFTYRVKHWFTHHPRLKLVAFILAIMAWFYISGEINRFN